MEVVVTTWAVRRTKLQSNCIVTINKPTPNFLQAGCPSCHPTVSKHWRENKADSIHCRNHYIYTWVHVIIAFAVFSIKQAVGGRPPRYAPPISSLCGRRSASRRQAHRNVAVVYHAQYIPMLTAAAAWCVKAAVSKAAWWPWPLTLKVASESRGLPLCQF